MPLRSRNDPDDLTEFLLFLPRYVAEACAQAETFDINIAEYYRDTTDHYACIVHSMHAELQRNADVPLDYIHLHEMLLAHMLAIRQIFDDRVSSLLERRPVPPGVVGLGLRPNATNESNGVHLIGFPIINADYDNTNDNVDVPCVVEPDVDDGVIRTGLRGRPSIHISPEQVHSLREIGFNWRSIASILCVSERTLRNRWSEPAFQEYNLEYSTITDEELDAALRGIREVSQRCGETLMTGALRSRGIRVQRWRIRESLTRIDPVGRALRRRRVIYRRTYSVPSPNYIWHIDGNHKLIDPWGFVIHGGIDGYSRLCVYLHCSTCNRAEVVLTLFREAVTLYGCPSRVRSDYGMENVEVAQFMINTRGMNRGSFITGLSTHNQRIERLWRDVKECVTCMFSDIFAYMENEGIADRYNPIHVLAVRYVFCPRINRALKEFMAQWNNHSLRTCNNQTPKMLWMQGMMRNPNLLEEDHVELEDDGAPLPDLQTNNNVQVPDVSLDISDEDWECLQAEVEPLSDDNCQGINIFLQTVEFLSRLQSQ